MESQPIQITQLLSGPTLRAIECIGNLPDVEAIRFAIRDRIAQIANRLNHRRGFAPITDKIVAVEMVYIPFVVAHHKDARSLRSSTEFGAVYRHRANDFIPLGNLLQSGIQKWTVLPVGQSTNVFHEKEARLYFANDAKEMMQELPAWVFRIGATNLAESLARRASDNAVDLPADYRFEFLAAEVCDIAEMKLTL